MTEATPSLGSSRVQPEYAKPAGLRARSTAAPSALEASAQTTVATPPSGLPSVRLQVSQSLGRRHSLYHRTRVTMALELGLQRFCLLAAPTHQPKPLPAAHATHAGNWRGQPTSRSRSPPTSKLP